MAKCMCGSPEWRIREKRLRKRDKYHVVCLVCEFEWWTDSILGITWITEEERKKLRDPFSRLS